MIKVCLAARHVKPLFTPLALLYLKAYLVEREGMPAGDITIREFAPEVAAEHIAAEIVPGRHRPPEASRYSVRGPADLRPAG